MKRWCLLALACLCAPAWADQPFSLSGRISLRQDEQAYYGTLDWQHAGDRDDLSLTGPFGQGAAELHRDASGAVLQLPDGTRHEASTLQALADRLFGAPIPIAALPDWLRGIAPDAYLDAAGRPKRLVLPDWTVEWLRYDDTGHPVLISLQSATVGVRLHVDSWLEGLTPVAPPPTITAPDAASPAAAAPEPGSAAAPETQP